MSTPVSEVAYIREQIRLECEALERMQSSFALIGSHEHVLRRYNRLGDYQEALAQHVGEEAAMNELMQTYLEVMG